MPIRCAQRRLAMFCRNGTMSARASSAPSLLRRLAGLGGAAVGGEDLADELVPRLVGGDRLAEVLAEDVGGDALLRPALHQHDVENVGEMARVLGAAEEPVDQLLALARRPVGE